MQTSDILPRAVHHPPHAGEVNSALKNSQQQSEQFGDVMDRTLNSASNELPDDEATQQKANPDGQKTATHATGTHHGKPAEKPKKWHRIAKSQQAVPQDVPTQPLMVNAAQITQLAIIESATEHAGNSENAPKKSSETAKSAPATGTSDGASKTVLPQLLTSAEAIGIPLSSAGQQNSTGATVANPAAGQPSPAVPLPTKVDAHDATVNHSGARSDDLKNSDAKAADAKTAEPKSAEPKTADLKTRDAKISSAKDPTNPGEQTAKDAASHDLAAVPGDPEPEQNAPPIDTAPPPPAADVDTKIAKITGTSAPPGSSAVFPPDLGGTSAAKQYVTMQKAEKTPKVAGQIEQELPGKPSLKGEELPMGQKSAALSHADAKVETTASAGSRATSALSTSTEPSAPTATSITFSPAIAADTRMRMLERTHDIVALHAMRLVEAGSNSLHVVVKPGEGVQLSLELRQNAGVVDVHASLHKGDYEHLSQYWPELQQRLEARGVRVGALTTSENFTNTSHQSFQQSKQQQSSDQDSLHAGAFAEFALAGSMTEAPAKRAARATAYRGWETWA